MPTLSDHSFDYIIIGAGSAGCVLADRLSEDPHVRVLLLEAGPEDRSPYIHMPVGFYKLTGGNLTWGYQTTPQRHANGRRIAFSQGKVLGGGSSINGMVYTRGNAADYDRWVNDEGCPGWSSLEVLPFFLRAESNNRLLNGYHGVEGPLGVSDQTFMHPTTRLFAQAAQQFGIPFNHDFNGAVQEGCGFYQINARNGRRSSAAAAYLLRARSRKNLRVETAAFVSRIVVESGKARAVEFSIAGSALTRATASREIIVSAGAFGSPKLLMLSGIGQAENLRQHGIDVVTNLPGVGQNLQDHIDVDTIYKLKNITSYDAYKSPLKKLKAGLEYLLFGGGPVTSNIVEGGAFWYSTAKPETPDLQLHFLPGAGVEESTPGLAGGSGCTLNSYFVRPRSRGTVTLTDADPRSAPLIDPNYWADPYDLERSLDGLRLSREIMAQTVLREYIEGEQLPGPQVQSRDELTDFLRAFGRTAYHPAGTCKMGGDDMAVVDPELRVRGIDGLRVVDASVMPSLVSSNTNAATIMIAERASDLIAGKIVSRDAGSAEARESAASVLVNQRAAS